jgi:hypothetical protein
LPKEKGVLVLVAGGGLDVDCPNLKLGSVEGALNVVEADEEEVGG